MAYFSIFPKDNPAQTLRIKRYFLAVSASLVVLALMAALYGGGYMPLAGLQWFAAGIVTCFVVFFIAFRSGLNLRFGDPSLTAAQMVSASVVIISTGFFVNNEARGTLLPILLMIFYFGIYRMDSRAMTQLALLNIALYGVLIAALYAHRRAALDLNLELLRWGVLALVSLWFGTIGGHVTKLRRELAVRKASIEALLERDDLTNVGNRRFLIHMLEQEKSRADRMGTPFCVAMIDLDYFKRVNDTYGHQAGDRILKSFTQAAQVALRKIDYFGRYGGEEFLLIMSETSMDGARVKAERLRSDVESTRFADVDSKLIQTVSIGIAEYRRGESIEQIQLRADKAMYKAKAKGRNRIETDVADTLEAVAPTRSTRIA